MKKQTRSFMLCLLLRLGMLPYGAAYAAQSGWTEEDGAMVYYDEDGYLTTDSWRKNGDDWYFFR